MKVMLTPQAVITMLLTLVPLAMTMARRASALALVAAALILLVLERKTLADRFRAIRFDPALMAGLAILAVWGAVSLLWSPLPARGAKQLVFDFLVPVLSGFVVLTLAGPRPSQKNAWGFAAALALAAALVAAQCAAQFRLETVFNPKEAQGELWRFNMVVVTFALLVPALLMLMRRIPVTAALAGLLVILAATLSQSATSKTALLSGFFAFALFRFVPRRPALAIAAAALFAVLAAQPWQGRLVEQAFQAAGKSDLLFQSAKERIVIWKATGEMALHAMPWGTGMGSSDAVSETAFAKTMPPELRVGLRQTHAHDAFLNILMELGLPGLIGLALVAFGILRTIARLPDALHAPAMALLAQIVTVDLISHGAWQAWWFSAIMLAILALRQYAPDGPVTPSGPQI